MMPEAAQVAGLGQDSERKDRADAWHLLQALEVAVLLELRVSTLFQLLAQLT